MKYIYIINEASYASKYGVGTYFEGFISAMKNNEIFNIVLINLHSVQYKEIEVEYKEGIKVIYVPSFVNNKEYNKHLYGNRLFRNRYYKNTLYVLSHYVDNSSPIIFKISFNHSLYLVRRLKEMFNCLVLGVIHYMEWSIGLNGDMMRLQYILNKNNCDKSDLELKVSDSFSEEKDYFNSLDHIISPSLHVYTALKELYCLDTRKINIVPFYINIDIGCQDKLELRRKWNLDINDKIVIFVGRICEAKGIHILVQAFKIVLEKIPQCKLIIIGSGSYDLVLKEADCFNSKIVFYGYQNKANTSELMCLSDLGVSFSYYETFGFVCHEMLQCNLPIIVSSVSGLEGYLSDEAVKEYNFIDCLDNVKIPIYQLGYKIISQLMKTPSPELLKKIGELNRSFISAMHSRLLRFYCTLGGRV